MALSSHATPEAARVYVKRTETQRRDAARKRRVYVEAQIQERIPDKSQNDGPAESQKLGLARERSA
jgi:hypothetical protein